MKTKKQIQEHKEVELVNIMFILFAIAFLSLFTLVHLSVVYSLEDSGQISPETAKVMIYSWFIGITIALIVWKWMDKEFDKMWEEDRPAREKYYAEHPRYTCPYYKQQKRR